MDLSAAHDGRIVALVVRDLAQQFARDPGGHPVVYHLTGPAGGIWQLGDAARAATVCMDALDLNLLASGRITAVEARALPATVAQGDPHAAAWALAHTAVVY